MPGEALLAGLLDLVLGEPPARVHPVVAMGAFLRRTRRHWQGTTPRAQLAEGARDWAAGAFGALAAGWVVQALTARLPYPARTLARAALLKPLFSARALLSAASEVERALARDDLPEARRLLGWHLVSRDTSGLSATEVAGAATLSLAENLSDSVVAPLLAYRIGGLPLAALYRFANTADAMWGYRTPDLEWAGKTAARADDLLNLAPARLTGGLIVAAAVLGGQDGPRAWRVMRRDSRLTPSPNAGWPMAAMAGALGVELTKRDTYVLGRGGRPPAPADLRAALRLARLALGLFAVLLLVIRPGGRRHA